MLRHLSLRDFVIVRSLDLELHAGFTALTGETGAGKSILVDALQLALGGRGDANVVRDGAARTDIAASFDTPASLVEWLDANGFTSSDDASTLLLRRSVDNQGRSRAWINGLSATATQLREAADHLVDIHGQHAWQSLTRPAAVRELLDTYGQIDTAAMQQSWATWQARRRDLELATSAAGERERERERLAWQLAEVDKLAPGAVEWAELNDEHKRLSNAQSLIDAAQTASNAVAEADDNAESLVARAIDALSDMVDVDERLAPALEVLQNAQAQLTDAAHTLRSYLQHADVDPQRLAKLDERMALWMSLARRFRLPAGDLAATRDQWQASLTQLEAASDVAALEAAAQAAEQVWRGHARAVSKARQKAAPALSEVVSGVMQDLGMAGGRFVVQLQPVETPQSFGLESIEFLVAGHAGVTPRPIAKVASGGELSRLALAIAVTTSQARAQDAASPDTLIFDEIDSGVGGSVADTVGRLMHRLGHRHARQQVLAVTHLAQVAACADHHHVVSKSSAPKTKGSANQASTESRIQALAPDERVGEIARMLGGANLATSMTHAQALLDQARSDGSTTTQSRQGKEMPSASRRKKA